MTKTPPTLTGPYGKAWLHDLEEISRMSCGRPHGSVASWILNVPWANGLWEDYNITLIHLRPVEGLSDPYIYLPGATHEIMVAAMHPDWPRDMLLTPISKYFLQPLNFVGQFICDDEESDHSARVTVQTAVIDILHGRLSPDTDYGQHWIDRFGSSMIKGDPKTYGETVIGMGSQTIKFDPAPLSKKPCDVLCVKCGMPVAAPVLTKNKCLRCAMEERR